MSIEWVLLKFSACWADEFDCESLIATTRDRWERFGASLREACGEVTFEAHFGTNEGFTFTADEYLSHFEVFPTTIDCVRDLARVVGRDRPVSEYEWDRRTKLAWFLYVEFGVLPRPSYKNTPENEEVSVSLHAALGFRGPAGKCAAHGNVISKCGERGCSPKDDSVVCDEPDAEYLALFPKGGAS